MVLKIIKVKPNSYQNKLLILEDGSWQVYLTAQPVNGEANKQLINFLSDYLKIQKSKITIQKGSQSRIKKVVLDVEEDFLNLVVTNQKIPP